jgi:hypothetical protein
MENRESLDPIVTERRLARELAELRGAIEMVGRGQAERVSLSGLRFGEQLIRRCRAEALREGVALEPDWWPEDAGCDLLVRRIGA